ncbi:MAG: trypsin-like peptidase domain-containing protein, partial [Chloroflexota bacterium]
MTTLKTLSDEMAGLVETVGASVVRVDARRRLGATGVVYSSDGVIVTSHHVVTRDEDIHVTLPDGETYPATLVGRDPST